MKNFSSLNIIEWYIVKLVYKYSLSLWKKPKHSQSVKIHRTNFISIAGQWFCILSDNHYNELFYDKQIVFCKRNGFYERFPKSLIIYFLKVCIFSKKCINRKIRVKVSQCNRLVRVSLVKYFSLPKHVGN